MTSANGPERDHAAPGALRRAAIRIAGKDRLAIPPTERLTATEKASAALALTRSLD